MLSLDGASFFDLANQLLGHENYIHYLLRCKWTVLVDMGEKRSDGVDHLRGCYDANLTDYAIEPLNVDHGGYAE